jgi:chemotaxis protein methyltransferase WspC
MNLAPVIDLLRQRIGLEPDSLGGTTLTRAVRARMRTLGLTKSDAYAARLAGDAQEFQLLLVDVAVPETWFFRGGEIFTYLAEQVAAAIRLRGSGKKFRILSVPCSTGEEPYSLAIALAELGVPPASWEIEALDLCSAHVEVARRATFGKFSFRQTAPTLRDRYFQPVERGWKLDGSICSRVRFRQGNLLDPLFLASDGCFDLILCRNLLIYLHAEARRQVLNTIVRLLAAEGWLCTGHADPLDFQDSRFRRTGPESYFLYRRAGAEQSTVSFPGFAECREVVRESEPARSCGVEVVKEKHYPTTSPPHHPASALASAAQPSPVDLLGRARQQADSGRLAEALASCQEQMARAGPSADLYSLMGVIHQARRENDEAVGCYERALYLEREHTEALAHLMLLSQERGDGAQAERLRRRLERVGSGGDT